MVKFLLQTHNSHPFPICHVRFRNVTFWKGLSEFWVKYQNSLILKLWEFFHLKILNSIVRLEVRTLRWNSDVSTQLALILLHTRWEPAGFLLIPRGFGLGRAHLTTETVHGRVWDRREDPTSVLFFWEESIRPRDAVEAAASSPPPLVDGVAACRQTHRQRRRVALNPDRISA